MGDLAAQGCGIRVFGVPKVPEWLLAPAIDGTKAHDSTEFVAGSQAKTAWVTASVGHCEGPDRLLALQQPIAVKSPTLAG
jgi:hypothetical protein